MSEDRLEIGWSCNHSGRIIDVNRGVIRCGCGHFSESLGEAVERLQGELDASHRFLNHIGPPPDLPLPDRLRHWQNYCRVMRDDMREKDTMITTLREHLRTNHDLAVSALTHSRVRHDKQTCATCGVLNGQTKETN